MSDAFEEERTGPTWTPEEVARVRLEERLRGVEEGRAAERRRIVAARDACFTGLLADDTVSAAMARFDRLLVRGEATRD